MIPKITKTNDFDHQTDITVEFTWKNSTEHIYTLKITKTGYSNHWTNIIIDFTLKHGTECIYIYICQFLKLPKQVSPNLKLTLQLNSNLQTGPGHI